MLRENLEIRNDYVLLNRYQTVPSRVSKFLAAKIS